MNSSTIESDAIYRASELLADLLEVSVESVVYEPHLHPNGLNDGTLSVGDHSFIVEYKSRSHSSIVKQAIEQLKEYSNNKKIPLLVVLYMGPQGKEACLEANMNWLDLSGNAHIKIGRHTKIFISGKSNQFKRQSRSGNLASPTVSRIIRWFLLNVEKMPHQHELAESVSASEGYVSKVVKRLIGEGIVVKTDGGQLKLIDPSLLLDGWRECYSIRKHKVIRGNIFSRSGAELMKNLSKTLQAKSIHHAFTGLAGAWLYDHFANFRAASLFLKSSPSKSLLNDLGFKESERGANTWLIVPNDDGVFDGMRELQNIPVVSQVQVYMDLKYHHERAEEAAEHLRKEHLNWTRHAR